jgi:L-ascorbate metabolism protein UlaG (beta-lactamase superfamily)
MKITKIGHCCLLIEEKGLRILTDPGNYSTGQDEVYDIDMVLITHEHPDHLHIDSLKRVLQNNPEARVVTNTAVAVLLDEAGIAYSLLKHAESMTLQEVVIEAIEAPHAEIYSDWPRVLNTGFFIAEKLFYPGDAFTNPQRPVDILALPVAGPWMKISEALAYALEIKPRIAFPVHDGILKVCGTAHVAPEQILPKHGIEFRPLKENEVLEA